MIGIDLVEIEDFKNRLKAVSAEKLFQTSELVQNSSIENLAGIFAAKEAFFKATGKKLNWLEVWIEKDESGKPNIFSDYIPGNKKADVSISHTQNYACAVVIILNK